MSPTHRGGGLPRVGKGGPHAYGRRGVYHAEGYFVVPLGIGHFGKNGPKSVRRVLGKVVEKNRERPSPTRGEPHPLPRVGDPPPSRGPFSPRLPHTPPRATWDFFWTHHYTPPSPARDMGLFSQKHSKFGHKRQATAPRQSVYCAPACRGEHWHHEYTLRKGLTWPDSSLAQ